MRLVFGVSDKYRNARRAPYLLCVLVVLGFGLEEQAEKLNINIVEEFGSMALKSEFPVKLGDRCTVFMESDLNSFMQKGARNENLVGGLAYSIVYNYLQKVVGDRRPRLGLIDCSST